MENKKQVAIYIRVSTLDQVREGYSLDAQEKTLRKWCEERKYNVYDLYGCHYEWTLEADLTNFRACRGGDYGHSLSLAYRSDNDPNNTGSRTSSRATLYIE